MLREGTLLLSFGPFLPFCYLFHKNHELLVVSISSAVCLLGGILVSSVFHSIIRVFIKDGFILSLFSVIVSVLFQSLSRYAFVRCYEGLMHRIVKTIGSSNRVGQNEARSRKIIPINLATSSLAAGLGWSLIHNLLTFGNIWTKSIGKAADKFLIYNPSIPFLLLASINSFLFGITDILLMVLCFCARGRYSNMIWTMAFVIHLILASLTLINMLEDGYLISIPLLVLTTFALGTLCRRHWGMLKKQIILQ